MTVAISDMFLLGVLWLCWCAMHSLLIAPSVQHSIKGRFPGGIKYFRMLYNLFSLVSLMVLLALTRFEGGPVIFSWDGGYLLIRAILFGCAMLLFIGGSKRYDMNYFLGIRQIRTGEEELLLGADKTFVETGVFGLTRHPWYLGSFCFLWSVLPAYPQKTFVTAIILSLYLWLGTLLEERKIMAQHPEEYGIYREKVSMLFPWKWIMGKLKAGG